MTHISGHFYEWEDDPAFKDELPAEEYGMVYTGGPVTVEQLYESFMDENSIFAEDVYNYFGGWFKFAMEPGDFVRDYGRYFSGFDPTETEFAEREKSLSIADAANVMDITNRATDMAYETETTDISTSLTKEIQKGREMMGRLGLRSGDVEVAVGDTIAASGNKVRNLGDRFKLQKDENKNKYDIKRSDAILDFDESDYDVKEKWYSSVLKMFDNLVKAEAFDIPPDHNPCPEGFVPDYEAGVCKRKSESRAAENRDYDRPVDDPPRDPSDIRLKENVEYIGNSPSGLKMYEFDYIYKPGRYRGVMANDMLDSPAVIMGNDGYYRVDYSKIDVNFERID